MRVLITGGFGYVGGRLARLLATGAHYDVVLASRRPANSPSWLSTASVVETDWAVATSLEIACCDIEAIVHLAGMNAQASAADPVAALEINALCTAKLVRAAKAAGVRRFVYLSTAHVYGPLRGKVSEETCPTGLHPYAATHRAAEDVVRMASEGGHLEGIVIRLSNAFGPPAHRDADCWTLLVNDLCRQAVKTGRMVLQSSGTQRRDFIAMSDACDAIRHLLELPAPRLGNGLFNVGGGWSPTVLQMAEFAGERFEVVTGAKPPIVRRQDKNSENTEPFCYEVRKLRGTGFQPGGKDASAKEIDGLVRFCLDQLSCSS